MIYLYLHPLNMDSSLVMQILFANEKAFENVKEKNECMKIYNICKLARENENIINTNNKNRAEIYSVRIFNCLKNKLLKKYKKVFLLNKINKQHNKLYLKAKAIKGFKILLSPIKDMEKYYINSSLSITAAGVSMYKQILCKGNSLIIPQTYNQKLIANLLAKEKLFHVLNNIKFLSPKRILYAINNTLPNSKSNFLDWNGKSRILEKIKQFK